MTSALPERPTTIGTAGLNIRHHLQRLFARRETIRYLVTSNLKAGHRDKLLGHLWNLLDPLLFMAVYFLVFGIILRQAAGAPGEFLLHLFVGILSWRFLDGTISQSTNCIRGRRGLVHEISFPKAVFPVSICFSRLYDYLWGLLVLSAVLLFVPNTLSWHIVWVPPLIALQLMFALGVAFLVAYLGAFYADTTNVVSVAMRLWFYASPIFYYVSGPRGRIPDRYLFYYMLNPIACFFESMREAVLRQGTPDPALVLYAGAVSLVMLLVGFTVFCYGEGKFAKYV